VLIRPENRVTFDEGTVNTMDSHENVKAVEADQEVRIQ
jgi:hypothetical protein